MRAVGVKPKGNAFPIAGKSFFGVGGIAPNVQVFSAGGTWTKPPGNIKSIVFTAVGPGGGGPSGVLSQAALTGIFQVPNTGAGGAGGWCQYTPNPALVPASVAIVIGTGGAGGAGNTVVGSIPTNQDTGHPGVAGSGPTNVGGGVIVCNAGGANAAAHPPGGTASCSLAWGGSALTQTGGQGATSALLNFGNVPPPTLAELTTFDPTGNAGESPTHAPGGGGGPSDTLTGGVRPLFGCYGGAPGGIGQAASNADIYYTAGGLAIPNTVGLAGAAGGPLGGGAAGQNISLNPSSSPAGNAFTISGGNGGNGGAGGGGGTGGTIGLQNFNNPGTMTEGSGGRGGDGLVTVVTTFA